METFSGWWQLTLGAVGTAHPAVLLLAAAVLPLVGMPASPLWFTAGVRLGTLAGFWLCTGALLINFTAGYWLARWGLRSSLTLWFSRRGWRIPEIPAKDEALTILLLRVTPGVPLCVQNYLLGLAGVKFSRYLLLSIPAQAAYALAFVWLGDSLASNALWRLVLAVAGLTGLVLLVSLLRRWLNRRTLKAASGTAQLMKP